MVISTDFELVKSFHIYRYNCTVMTYAKQFYEMNKPEYAGVETIVCDEIHNFYKCKGEFHKEEDKTKGIKECKNYENVVNNIYMNARNGSITVVGFTAIHNRIKREMDFLLSQNGM